MPKTALVLSGGGAKGAFQVTAEKYAREQKGYKWDIIAGVSVGALNAGMLAMGKYARLLEIWETITNARVYTGRMNRWALVKMLFGARSALGHGPLKELIDGEFDPALMKADLRVGAVSLNSGEYVMFRPDHPQFKQAVLASTAIPVVWPPVLLDPPLGEMVDGGVRNVSPLGDVLDDDPDEIIIINCNPGESEPKEGRLKNALDIGKRSLDIAVNEIFVGDVREFVRINLNVQEAAAKGVTLHNEKGKPYKYFNYEIIDPDQRLGDGLDFSQASVRRSMEMGRRRAEEVLGPPRATRARG